MEKTPLIKVDHLGITFGGLRAVNDFSLEMGENELIGLIGPNGAGKTTVFNILTGVYVPTEGDFYFCGEKMNGKKTHQVVQSGIARTFQNIRLFKQMTVLENVKVAMNPYYKYNMAEALFRTGKFWASEHENDIKARELLKIFNLQDKAEYVAENLPYGQQRKLEIARALATGMKLLLLDEPAAGMNPTETAELLDCIKVIRERFNISILLIEHDMSLVMKICEHILVIDYGTTIARGTPEEISSNPDVIAAYLGAED
jgi:branched-chain amino acid transport system ATP-binding protein